MNVAEIAQALGKFTTKQGGGFTACCPSHQDDNPSLSIDDADNGGILVKCWAGCSQDAVISALKDRGLWPAKERVEPAPHITPKVVGRYDYHGADGKVLYSKERLEPGRNGKKKEFRFRHIDAVTGKSEFGHGSDNPHLLYNLPAVIKAKSVLVFEGERLADLATEWGLVGTSLDAGSTSRLTPEHIQQLSGKRVAVLRDNDEAGLLYATHIANDLHGKCESVKVILLPGLAPKEDFKEWREKAGNTKAALLDIIKTAPEWEITVPPTVAEIDDAWPEPVLFGEIDTPEIRADDALPGTLADFAKAVAESAQTPQGMAVMMILSVVATCLQKRFEVCPYGDGYTEPVNIMTVTGAEPATRKSANVKATTAPLTIWEDAQAEGLKDQVKQIRHQRDMLINSINSIKSGASKSASTDEDRMVALKEIKRLEDTMPPEVVLPELWTDDVTMETLGSHMADHGERMSVISAEGGFFEVMAGLYSGGKSNVNVVLQGHAGEPMRVKRQGRSVTMEKPALTFGLMVQPSVISDLAAGNKARFRGNGALARLLYCMPKSNIGSRDVTKRRPIPTDIQAKYHSLIFDLLSIPPLLDGTGKEQPRLLTLAPDALRAWVSFSQYIESKQGQYGEYHSIADWTGKLPGAALRIAGLCHVAEFKQSTNVISEATIGKALDLAELLIIHAKAAFGLMGTDAAIPDAKYILRWIIGEGKDSFRRGDLHSAAHGRFERVDRLISALKVLIERNIISEPQDHRTGRRPAIVYTVNPAILKGGN